MLWVTKDCPWAYPVTFGLENDSKHLEFERDSKDIPFANVRTATVQKKQLFSRFIFCSGFSHEGMPFVAPQHLQNLLKITIRGRKKSGGNNWSFRG